MVFPDKVYNVLKWVVITALPALTAFLGLLLPLCGVSAEVTTSVLAIIGACTTFLGTLIGVSSASYNKQKEEIKTDETHT